MRWTDVPLRARIVVAGIAALLLAPAAETAYALAAARAGEEEGPGPGTILFEGDSAYNHITVWQRGRLRCLLFGSYREQRETCIDQHSPSRSVFEYTAMMFVGFLHHPRTASVALLGLGGGYMPLVFRASLPSVDMHVIEIDPLVAKLAREHFGFVASGRQRLSIADGRQQLRADRRRYDQIWIDAFNGDYIPSHLTTKEFLELVKTRLNPGGLVVENVHHSNRLFDAQVATFRAVFSHVWIYTGQRSANSIIVAADAPPFTPERFMDVDPQPFGGRIGSIDLYEEAAKLDHGVVVPAGTPVLTDDFSPANHLYHKPSESR